MRPHHLLLTAVLAACQPAAAARYRAESRAVLPLDLASGLPYCTAWHVTSDVWATARHCTEYALDNTSAIGGVVVEVLAQSEEDDVGLLRRARAGAYPALQLGEDPYFGLRVHYVGYPQHGLGGDGDSDVHHGVYEGYVGDQHGREWEFSAFVDGGASGSPLMDDAGRVVGVVVASYRGRPYGYAVPVSALRELLAHVAW